jgi:hypothetical protein
MPNTAKLILIQESEATPKYDLMRNLSDLFNGWQYERHIKNYVFLCIDGDYEIDGNLILDNSDGWVTDNAAWRKRLNIIGDDYLSDNFGVRGLIINGNLTVKGGLINSNMNDGPFLLVMGNISARNLMASGGYWRIKGNADVRGVAYGNYNDGSIHIDGDLSCPVFINSDHDFGYGKLLKNKVNLNSNGNNYPELNDDTGEYKIPKKLRELLSDDVLAWEDIVDMLGNGKEVLAEFSAKATVKDAAFWLKMVSKRGDDLGKVPKDERSAEICMAAVKDDGGALVKVPKALITQEMVEIAVEKWGTALAYVPKKMRTYDVCLTAIKGNCNFEDVPDKLIDKKMTQAMVMKTSSYMLQHDDTVLDEAFFVKWLESLPEYTNELQMWFSNMRAFKLEDIIIAATKVSLPAFDNLAGMYVTQKVFDLAKSLYEKDTAWPDVCHRHSKAWAGGSFSNAELKALVGTDNLIDESDVISSRVDNALKKVWVFQIDSQYVRGLITLRGERFQQVSYIAHHLMDEAVVKYMLAKSNTNIQYLPYHLITDRMCLDIVNDWYGTLDSVPKQFRSLNVCKVALDLCRKQNDYLLDDLKIAIPLEYHAELGL